jgi:peptidoglycan/LPS O-acetylase OafA/YrhL
VPEIDDAPPRVVAETLGEDAAPPTASNKFRYEASLDGLRALALLAIIAYHFNYTWARGAYLSVDLFFILSGFLITTLLIMEWRRTDTIALRAFWGRRARRLLPALLVLLVFVAIFTRFEIDPWNRAAIRGDGIASLFYVANWRFIADKQGYFELFSAASPLRHMWTLAIEEQFYLVWPLIVYVVMRVSRGSLRALAAVCGIGVVASIAVMVITYGPGDPLRAYYGTDARAHTILIGALLAILLAVWTPSAAAKRRLTTAGIAAFVVMMYAWNVATGTSSRYYHGGSALYAVLACIVIAGALQPGALRTALGFRPLAWIGRLSYGLYLFHWPLIVWLVPSRVHLSGLPLNGLRLALTFVAATLSFYLIEAPIREGRRPSLPWQHAATANRRARASQRKVARWLALPAVVATLAVVLASSTGATAAPSYLSGTQTPSFAFAAPTPAPVTASNKSARSPTGKTPSTSRRAAPDVTFVPPKLDFIWKLGDPLFCGTPRPGETKEAVDEAHKLGVPGLSAPAAGMRILILGDSTACSLFPGMKAVGDEVGASVAQAAVFGCGMASGNITSTRGDQITPDSNRCPAMVDAAQVPAVTQMRPDIVIWDSLWEKEDPIVDGEALVSGTPAGDAEMLKRMNATLALVTAYGAKVVMLTAAAPAPNDAETTNNVNKAVDDASYARLDSIDRRFAAQHPDQVTLVDLAHRLCPNGPPCPETVDGLRMRPDGRHFTPTAAAVQAEWLLPQIVAVAHT